MSSEKALSIYFCGSIQGGRDDADIYRQLIDLLKTYGSVPTAAIGDEGVAERDLKNDPVKVHDRNMVWFRNTDVVVAEVTQPSLGVGYEMGWAAALKKPTLCLFRTSSGRRLSCMIAGAVSDSSFQVRHYTELHQAVDIIKNFLDNFKKAMYTSPSMDTPQTPNSSEEMSIYFCGSIQGGRDDAAIYTQLIDVLKKYGSVPTAAIGDEEMADKEAKVDPTETHSKYMAVFRNANVVVAEVTQPSLGVGYEMGWAAALKKPTLCLFRTSSGRYLSSMIAGAVNGTTFQVRDYTEVDQAVDIIKNFLDQYQKK